MTTATAQERRLRRSPDQKMIAGVIGGLAEYFDRDPALLRILYVFISIWDEFLFARGMEHDSPKLLFRLTAGWIPTGCCGTYRGGSPAPRRSCRLLLQLLCTATDCDRLSPVAKEVWAEARCWVRPMIHHRWKGTMH